MYTATYSAEDNKPRLYAASRLDAETYARARAAGFVFAPKQQLFVAPRWTPEAEDFLLTLCEDIEDEETPLEERALERASRFKVYSGKRAVEAEEARAHVERITGGIPLGQPILVGHHSERRARKDAERIEDGMRKAVQLWGTSKYWETRARRVEAHAAYKADPGLRARRVATLEADKRRHQKDLDAAAKAARIWGQVATIADPDLQLRMALRVANSPALTPRFGLWGELRDGKTTAAAAVEQALAWGKMVTERASRWIAHLDNRLAYERVLLGRAPDEETPRVRRKSPSAALPLVNYRAADGKIEGRNRYSRHDNDPVVHLQVEMTLAEYVRIPHDQKGTGVAFDGTHRFRVALRPSRGGLVAVFVTDSKVHPRPPPAKTTEPQESDADEAEEAPDAAEYHGIAPPEPLEEEEPATLRRAEPEAPALDHFAAMSASLKAGVHAVSVPELFVTPPALAERVVDRAEIKPGDLVLEPEAGLGGLAKAARARGGAVVCVDREAACTLALRQAGFVGVFQADFLEIGPETSPLFRGGQFDCVLMNPPFSAEIDHVRRAWRMLKPGGRLVAIMSAGIRYREDGKTQAFRKFVSEQGGTIEALPDGSFAASGTGVSTVLVTIGLRRAG